MTRGEVITDRASVVVNVIDYLVLLHCTNDPAISVFNRINATTAGFARLRSVRGFNPSNRPATLLTDSCLWCRYERSNRQVS